MRTNSSTAAIGRLPKRRVQWLRAARALSRLRGSYESTAIMEFDAALEGDDGERGFHEFLAQPDAAALLAERPNLPMLLDDVDALSRMPEGSLGRAYLALAQRDGIRAGSLVEGSLALPDEEERAPDPVRRWYRDRMTATHDLLHVLTGYDRDRAGETALIAFSLGTHPMRVFRVSLVLALLAAPKRRWFRLVHYLYRAWLRGRHAHIRPTTAWEELLPLPLPTVRRRLRIASVAEVHPEGVWKEGQAPGRWLPTGAAGIVASITDGPDSVEVRRRYDAMAADYDRHLGMQSGRLGRYLEGVRKRAVAELQLERGQTVIDVGCGTGASFARLVAAVGPDGRVIGVDQSQGMLEVAAKRIADEGWTNVELIEAPLEQATLPQADAAILFFTHDLLRTPAALGGLTSVVRGGGRIVAAGMQRSARWLGRIAIPARRIMRRYITTEDGLAKPWDHLADRLDDVTFESLLLGAIYILAGRRPAPPVASRSGYPKRTE